MPDFNFTITHLDFAARATTPIVLPEFKGSALRGAWQGYMQKAYCGAPPAARTDPMHQAMCPVCYLTSRDTGSESRRPFALVPPLDHKRCYEPGDVFRFTFSLFGNAHMLFPYVLLALREVGESQGMGGFLPELGGRGRFQLVQVQAYDPHLGGSQILWQEDRAMVETSVIVSDSHTIASAADQLLAKMAAEDAMLRLSLLTPLRLTHHKHLMHRFEFPIFFQRLLERLYGLAQHFSAEPERYGRDELSRAVRELTPLAERVQVAGDETAWWDVKGYSQRRRGETYLGGLVGDVTLASADWPQLLPYLLWGQSVQLGKNVVKGGGWYTVGDEASMSPSGRALTA